MSLEEYLNNPATYRKLMNLIELMSERNLLIDIINALEFQKINSDVTKREFNVLYSKYMSKLSVIDNKLTKESSGLICIICNTKIEQDEVVIACPSCGMPFHYTHFINYIKDTGYCIACGEYFTVSVHNNFVLIEQQISKSASETLKKPFPRLRILFRGKILTPDTTTGGRELLCPECKSKIHPNWIYCKYCGVKIKDTERVESRQADQKVHTYVTCPRCGNQVNTSWKYCKWCGNKFTSE